MEEGGEGDPKTLASVLGQNLSIPPFIIDMIKFQKVTTQRLVLSTLTVTGTGKVKKVGWVFTTFRKITGFLKKYFH